MRFDLTSSRGSWTPGTKIAAVLFIVTVGVLYCMANSGFDLNGFLREKLESKS